MKLAQVAYARRALWGVLLLGCGTEPVSGVTGAYILTATYSGQASECVLRGAELQLDENADRSLTGSLESGELACERSDPDVTPMIFRPATVRGGLEDGELVFSLRHPNPDFGVPCTLFVFTIEEGGRRLSGDLHTVQVFCQTTGNEMVSGGWIAEPR